MLFIYGISVQLVLNLNMEILVIHTENKKQLEALKALVKSWGIGFEKYPYDLKFVEELKLREKNVKKVIQLQLKTLKISGKV
nr:hypothetical protein [Pseudopedobacter sp.]